MVHASFCGIGLCLQGQETTGAKVKTTNQTQKHYYKSECLPVMFMAINTLHLLDKILWL